MQDHRNLMVWQKARALEVRIYRAVRRIARLDKSGLASQIRRAARSVPSNIAEGCSRPTNKDFAKFLGTSIASASELEDHLEFTRDVDLLPPNDVKQLLAQLVEVRRMLYGLLKKVQEDNGDGAGCQ